MVMAGAFSWCSLLSAHTRTWQWETAYAWVFAFDTQAFCAPLDHSTDTSPVIVPAAVNNPADVSLHQWFWICPLTPSMQYITHSASVPHFLSMKPTDILLHHHPQAHPLMQSRWYIYHLLSMYSISIYSIWPILVQQAWPLTQVV